MGIRPHRYTKCTSKTEIRKLEVVVFIDEQILRFEITVQDAMRVTI